MIANDDHRSPAADSNSGSEPQPPPVDPADRPRIEPTDGLPTEQQNDSGFVDSATSSAGDTNSGTSSVASSEGAPTPPPADPADRPRIEPTDALPTDQEQETG